jgi:non-lysosomal glucosylceramidase
MTELVSRSTRSESRAKGYTYKGEALRHVAMPLGGVGTGQIALGGDGGLRQWQIVNQVNHCAFVPDSFFALRVFHGEPQLNETRILQSHTALQQDTVPTPLVNDDDIPEEQQALLRRFGGVERTEFTGQYPFAKIRYQDAQLPLEIELEAYSPFIPLDPENSGLPVILFTFTLLNSSPHGMSGCLGAALQNIAGWDGLTPISGNRCPLYGGNVNRAHRRSGYSAVVMDNPSLPDDHAGAGQIVLASPTRGTQIIERWSTPEQLMQFMRGFNPVNHLGSLGHRHPYTAKNTPFMPTGASPVGTTWNGGILVPFRLAPGETTQITFFISWYFPNRYLNFDQFGPPRNYGKSKFWIGNAYAARFSDAIEVIEYVLEHQQDLERQSRTWAEGIYGSTLPNWLNETIAAQGTYMRSPTCFWTEDGRFYGFEGALGESTVMWNANFGGSCPLNCTHVWNYEMALSRLFPQLERSMRETDLEHAQAPEGYIPHRTVLPLYLPQFWNEPIGGPSNPALDGMLGTVLKFYREVRQGAGQTWLNRLWSRVKRLMNYIIAMWDENRDGVLEGEQPNTYDIAFYGPNMYIGALWLAALRAAEELAIVQGEQALAQEYCHLFERGSKGYDELLWNGEYYIQIIDPSMPSHDQFGEGCLADQLFGQWWAHLLDLGYLLPREHVQTTLRSIIRYNTRRGFRDFEHVQRIFADQDDTGLLDCTWPHGGRPQIPVRYCDEVWTGIEYHVGALCIIEGLLEEGMGIIAALRERYNGIRRNPYNEIECGDHYARAMAGWSALEALSGFRYNDLEKALSFAPMLANGEFHAPFITGSGWGTFAQVQQDGEIYTSLACTYGEIRLQRLSLGNCKGSAIVTLDTSEIRVEDQQATNGTLVLLFAEPITLQANSHLKILTH